ncbi:MAG: flagellar export chaperone FliS [Lachnospiraceae bacterium]|nr:flagellar export chaperone FliS [Lachnospiraceae bacterium]
MKATAAYQQYKNSKVLTASPAELTLMLYDGCIKFCNMAVMDINGKDFYKANKNIQKAERIIGEFKMTLDHRYEVAKDFDNIYDYVLRRLHEANMTKDTTILDECITHMRSLRDTWKEVMKRAGQPAMPEAAQA